MHEMEAFIKSMWRNHKGMLLVVGVLVLGGLYLLARSGAFHQPAPPTHTDTYIPSGNGSGIFGQVTSGESPAGQPLFFDSPDTGTHNALIPFMTMEQQWMSDSGLGPGWYQEGLYHG